MEISFTAYSGGDRYQFAANCPFCGAIYWERARYVRGDVCSWRVAQASRPCAHFRGVNRKTDRAEFTRTFSQKVLEFLERFEGGYW